MGIEILYEDNHLLVAVKPPNIPVQGDISGAADLLTILKEDVKIRYNKPGNVFLGLVHRLDRPVGGVMVFARTSKAASRLSEQIRNHQMQKIYLCVVRGCPESLKGRLTDTLLKDRAKNVVSVVEQGTPGAKQAILDYEVLKSSQGLSLIKVNLLTGRSHQIRVQMSNNKTPLVGDNKYGYQGDMRHKLALWSHQIGINHPTTKERMLFTSSPPNQFPWTLFT
ncbi:MAG TPA: RluA family pseudouridine synthase [Clostridiaceae bacterium]|nr:RluA family pseudouridine synthase [Clostridiaceae bacterium]